MTLTLKSGLLIAAAFLLAGVLSYALTPFVKVLAGKIGAVDVPKDGRRMHKVPIPRMGGLAIFIGFIVATFLFVPMTHELKAILIGAVLIMILGVVDDVVALPAWVKFLGQIAAAIVPVAAGVRISIFSNLNIFSQHPFFNLGVLSAPLTVLWIVGITNAVNLIDGLDGLAAGVSSIACISLLVISLLVSEPVIAILIAALAGGCIGFMPYNINPAKIFMGDCGALFIGYMLATVSIQGFFKFYAVISFAVPFLILGLPIFDTSFAIIRRLAKGQSPMKADRGHLHHKLIDMGFSQKQAVAILYCLSAILGLCAVVLTSSGVMRALMLLIGLMLVMLIAAKVMGDVAERERELEKRLEEERLYEKMCLDGGADEPHYEDDETEE